MNINEIPEGFELVKEEVETNTALDSFNEDIDPLLTDDEEAETNEVPEGFELVVNEEVEVETTDLEIPEGFELVVEEEVEEPVYSEEEIKEAKTWISPDMLVTAKKELKWGEDEEIDDIKITEAWKLYKSKTLGIEEEVEEEVEEQPYKYLPESIPGLDEATLKDVNKIINEQYKKEDGTLLEISTLSDFLNEKAKKLEKEQLDELEKLLGKPIKDFETKNDKGEIVYDIPEDKIKDFKKIIKKYQLEYKSLDKDWNKAEKIFIKYKELADKFNERQIEKEAKEIKKRQKEIKKRGEEEQPQGAHEIWIQEVDENGKWTDKKWNYYDAKKLYVDAPIQKGEKPDSYTIDDYITEMNNRAYSGSGKKLIIVDQRSIMLEETEFVTYKKDWKEKTREKYEKLHQNRQNLKWWKRLLENDSSEEIFTFSQAKGAEYLRKFLPEGFRVAETGAQHFGIPYTRDFVTVTAENGEYEEFGFDYDSDDKSAIRKQRAKLVKFLSKNSTKEQIEKSREKVKTLYQIVNNAQQTAWVRGEKGGFNVDHLKIKAYDKYSINTAPNIFNPKFVKAATEAQRKERSKLGGIDLGFDARVLKEKKGISVDELYYNYESLGIIPWGSTAKLEEHEGGYHLVYNENAVNAQKEALKILIEQRTLNGVKNGETPELVIGLDHDSSIAKGLNITQIEVDNLAREILGNQEWDVVQRRAFEDWVETDRNWTKEEKVQMGVLFKTMLDKSRNTKKAVLANAHLEKTASELTDLINNPGAFQYSKLYDEFKNDKSIVYKINPGEGYYNVDGRKIPSYIINGLGKEQERALIIDNNYKRALQESNFALDHVVDYDDKWKIYRSNYNDLEQAGKTFVLGIGNMGVSIAHGIYKLATLIPDAALNTLGYNTQDFIDKAALNWSIFKDKELGEFAPRVKYRGWETGYEFGSYWMVMGAEQFPIYMAMLTANLLVPGSSIAIAATAGLSTYSETDWTMRKAVMNGQADYSEGEIMFKGLLSGVNELTWTYLFGAPLIRKGGQILRGKGGDIFKKFNTGKRDYIRSMLPHMALGYGTEFTEESTIMLVDNLIHGRDKWEHVEESGMVGGVFGFSMIATPSLAVMMSRDFTNGETLNSLLENNKTLTGLYKENSDLEKKISDLEYKKFTQEGNLKHQQHTQQLIDDYKLNIKNNNIIKSELLSENKSKLEETEDKLKNRGLGGDAFKHFTQSQGNLFTLQNQVIEIQNDQNKSKENKKIAINILTSQYNNIRNSLEKFKSKKLWGHGYYSLLASSFKNKKSKNLINELRGEATERILLKKGGEYDIKEKELDTEAAKIYVEKEVKKQIKINKKGNPNLKSAETKKKAVIVIDEHYDPLIEKETNKKRKEQLIKERDNAVDQINDGSVNGVYLLHGDIKEGQETFLAIEENMVNNENIFAGDHEIAHGWSVRAIAENPENFNKLGEAITVYMQESHSDVWERMKVSNQNIYNQDGSIDYEEVISSFVEAVGRKNIKINNKGVAPALLGKLLNEGLKKTNNKTIPFKGQNDIIGYFKGIAQAIVDGNLKLETPTRTKTKVDGESKQSFSKSIDLTKVANQEKLNELVGETNAEGYYTMPKSDWTNSQAEIVSKKLVDQGSFDKLIGAKIQTGKNIHGETRENILEDAKEELKKHIERFNPPKTNIKDLKSKTGKSYGLFGYINTWLGAKVGTVTGRAKRKVKTVPTSQQVGGAESKVTVGERLVSQEMSPEEATDIALAQDMLKKIKPQTSKIAKKLGLTTAQENLVKRDIINYLRDPKRPSMDNPKKFFKGFVDHMSDTTGARLYGKIPNKKGMKAFLGKFASDLIALNKVDPAVMRRSNWDIFYEVEIENMNPTQTKKAINEGRVPEKTSLTAGNTLWKTLNPTPTEVVDYLMNIRQDQIKEKLPKFFAEVLGKNEFNEIVDNPVQPVYTPEGKIKKGEKIDLKESITTEEFKVGKPKVKDIIARPEGIKFSKAGMQNMVREMDIEPLTIKGGKKVYSLYDFTGKDKDKNKTIKLSDKEAFKKWIIEVVPRYLPVEFITKTSLAGYGDKAKYFYFTSDEVTQMKKEAAKNQKEFTAEERAAIKEMVKGLGDYKSGIWANIKYLVGTAEYKKRVDLNYEGLKIVWNKFQDMIAANENNVKFIVGMLETGSQSSSHWLRNAAMPRGYDRLVGAKWSGKTHIKEHVWPQNMFAEFMLEVAIIGANKGNINVDKVMPFVKNNYFQMLITINDDNKLKDINGKYGIKYDFQSIPPKEFLNSLKEALKTGDLTKAKSIWTRYVNSLVNNNDGGFNLNNLIFDGKSVASIFNVDVSEEHRNNPEVVQLQNKLIEAQLLGQDVKPKKVMYFFTRDLATPKDNALKVRKKEVDGNKVISKFSQSANSNNVNRESQILDKALQIARDPNAPVKKIRVFDFDDTLARTKSNVIYNKPNTTDKPSSNLKAIVMAGGPGSGKSSVIKKLGLQNQGYKVVNQDISLEWAKKLVGLDAKEAAYDAVQRSVRSELGALARKIADKKLDQYTTEGKGVILDGTGASIKATEAKVKALKDKGYEVSMIYVETTKETALERNRNRKERSLKDKIVETTWNSVNANKQAYKSKFGESFFEVDANESIKKLPNEVINNIDSKLNATIRGKISPAEFASKGTEMESEGTTWDFSEFKKVVDGKKGPLLEVARKIQEARGTEDVFVLTARPQEAAGPIKEFLESIGLNIPINNITGLADSSPLAKSGWVVDKAAEGYNDFYFADDHAANVEAVKLALENLDVKGKVQQAKVKFSKSLKSDLEKNPNYNKFRDLIAKEKLFHGGSVTLGDFNAVWFVTGDVYGAWSYALDNDSRVYSVEAKDLKDAIIIPDINDSRGFLEIVKEKFPDQVDAIQNRIHGSGRLANGVDIKRVLKQPNASEILNEYMDWAQGNFEMGVFPVGAGRIKSLYDGESIAKGLPVIVVNRPGDWQTTRKGPKLVTEVKMMDVWRKEKAQEKKAVRKEYWNKAVQKVLNVVDIKRPTQQAKVKFSQSIDGKINEIIEGKTGIEAFKQFSPAKAKVRGKNIGKFKFFIPPSADDFVGLLYHMLGKGKEGDAQMAWFKENLLDPYARAMADITRDRVQMMADFKALKKNLKNIPKNLRKEAFDGYTYENVIRIYAWNKQGDKIPGLSKTDLAKVEDFMAKNPELQIFADQLIDITKGDGYNKPNDSWLSGTITTDFMNVLNNNKRKAHLKQWQDNIDLMFSEKNLNKLEAAFGTNYREALENMIHRMETGSNRGNRGTDRIANRFLDYVNNSVGIVMFFNMRSALLQTISAVNFINWSDNNMLAAGKAFANQPQFWKDFMRLMNSDFLVDRRNGLKINVSESEIADAAATSKNKAKGVIAYILKKGFIPTQFADSFAIASGGATFYRNRLNKYKKEGLTEKEAEEKAFNDFREIAEESQQSSRPDRISQQQAGGLGRIILAFANTPMQYTRLIKKASLDLVNGRGDWKSNVSRIVYYAAIQNVIFNALQSAIFALAWGEEDEEKEGISLKEKKTYGVINSMLDSILRGTGIAGGILSVLKNMSLEIYERSGKKRPEYSEVAYRLLDISPPIDIKVSKLKQAANNYEYNQDLIKTKGFAIDNPGWLSLGYVISATTNIPLDRLILKMNNVKYALNSDDDAWKKVAAILGYQEWQLRTEVEQEVYQKKRKAEKAEHKSLMKWEVIDGDEIESLSKREQINILTDIGLSDEEIKELKYEADRVNKILEEYDKDKKKVTKILDKRGKDKKLTEKEIEYNKIEDQTKAQQVKTLTEYGLTKKEIRELKYEDDRVKKILELQEE